MIWIEQGLTHHGVTIDLGYRDHHTDGSDWLEPVARITRDGKPVVDAMVFHRPASASPDEAAAEMATVYDAADDGRYGQAKMRVTEGATECVVNVRIVLPEVDRAWEHELTIPVP